MYNPIELVKKIEKIVLNDNEKKYYRFRPTRFYGGIATADTVGCNLRCKFCWSANSVWNTKNTGRFYSPENVANKLLDIAELKGYNQVRISGGEPTIGKKHLINILENIYPNLIFILETNGILLGTDETYVEVLSKFKNLHIRVCIKGINSKEFSLLTGAEIGYEYQIKSLEYLRDSKMSFNIALVSTKRYKQNFYDRLIELDLDKIILEEEKIKLYPHVRNRLLKEGLIEYFE
jgi:uncharacterized Fe-S cluster-containing radical SAM superfamily protein